MLPLPFAKINDHVFTKAPLPIYYGPAGNGASGLSSLRIVHLGDGGVAGGACVIAGGSDVVVPVKYGKRFHAVLPGSSFNLIQEEDHNFGHDHKSAVAIGAEYFIRVLSRN